MFTAKVDYFETIDGLEILQALKSMARSEEYVTKESYTPHSEVLLTFVEKHQEFIRKHPNTNAQHYVSNLKIMCRRR
jgi:hypothetical protein